MAAADRLAIAPGLRVAIAELVNVPVSAAAPNLILLPLTVNAASVNAVKSAPSI